MVDIIKVDAPDMGIYDTQTNRAANILSVQVGQLTYAPDLGIDLKYFLANEYKVQNESFRSYLIQVLANNSINVASVLTEVDSLSERLIFNLVPSENNQQLIAR